MMPYMTESLLTSPTSPFLTPSAHYAASLALLHFLNPSCFLRLQGLCLCNSFCLEPSAPGSSPAHLFHIIQISVQTPPPLRLGLKFIHIGNTLQARGLLIALYSQHMFCCVLFMVDLSSPLPKYSPLPTRMWIVWREGACLSCSPWGGSGALDSVLPNEWIIRHRNPDPCV